MKYALDPALVPAMAELKRGSANAPRPVRGDWQAVRASANAGQAYMPALSPTVTGVTTTDFTTETFDSEATLLLRWYAKTGKTPGSAVVYAHGGGMLGGSVDLYDEVVAWYVAHSGIPFLSVDLRLAPEAPTSTAMAEDVYSALIWLREHAASLGVNPDRIALMGDSGGGGPTAGAAILARDRNIPVAKQILIYPMLDDRHTKLARHGVPIELHVHPGAPHGFERFVPDSDIARRAMTDRIRTITDI